MKSFTTVPVLEAIFVMVPLLTVAAAPLEAVATV